MKNISKFLPRIVCLILMVTSFDFYAQEIGRDKIFFYNIKVIGNDTSDFSYIYGATFDKDNYNKIKSDEFERDNYKKKIKSVVKSELSKINFNDKFTALGTGYFGEYDFNTNSFPITSWFWDEKWHIGIPPGGYSISTVSSWNRSTYIVNFRYFTPVLKISADKANAFIKSRKNEKGQVNREVYLNATYSILDKVNPAKTEYFLSTYIYSIDIYSDKALTKKLGTLYPSVDYYDKVYGIRIKDGKDTLYYDDFNNLSHTPGNARYYQVVNYMNGKISGTVNYYYKSGTLLMEGNYSSPYYPKMEFANGPFTWYYEKDGQKEKEVNYSDGKMNGLFRSWHSNGQLQEEINYINDLREGCHYQWDSRGSCNFLTVFKYFPLYKNGVSVSDWSKECPCINPSKAKDEETQTNKLKSNNPSNENNPVANTNAPITEDGKNKKVYDNGDIYIGTLKDGKKDRYGKMVYENGNIYEGEWKDDEKNGQGKLYIYKEGITYDGGWKNDNKEGYGTMTWDDGYINYQGGFKNGVPDGQGITYDKGKKVYDGEWKNGKKDGKGTLIIRREDITLNYSGGFVNGLYDGQGTYTTVGINGTTTSYVGNFVKGEEDGQGTETIKFSDGGSATFTGEFKNGDKFNGVHYLTSAKGNKGSIEYKNGKAGKTKKG